MMCPKCEIGRIARVRFKSDGQTAYLCDFCESLWLADETISVGTGHTLDVYSKNKDMEYSIEDIDEKDQEHKPAKYL